MAKPSDFRSTSEYKEVLFEMFLAYTKSDEFGTLSKAERIKTVDCISEINMIVCEDINK